MLHHVMSSTAKVWKTLGDEWLDRVPGIALCLVVSAVSLGVEVLETRSFGHPYVEALVVAILAGMTIRAFWRPGRRWVSGIAFSAKQLLEFAVMLLGASLSLAAIAASGTLLLGAVVATVIVSLTFSYGVSRMLRLPTKISILIACGNSICGNSAIAAAAPVIGASSDDVGASISFTAILGVIAVLGLPLFIPLLGLSEKQYGILAGLTVYAVPQVLAATVPVGLVSTQIGTLVKLIRVMLLGPVLIGLSFLSRRIKGEGPGVAVEGSRGPSWVPWFIPGFLLFATLRSLGLVPDGAILPIAKTAGFLTVVSMAALGLGVDLTLMSRVGGRVTAAVLLSLMLLLAISLAVVRLF